MRAQITRDGNRFEASPAAIDPADLLTIEDVAEQLGVPVHVVRWRVDPLPGIGRRFGRHRYFSRADVQRLRVLLP